jgi:SEC-C motif-containing protein
MCYCGKPNAFDQCCGQYIEGEAHAPTAEALMRSRYSAFILKDFDYLGATHDPQTLEDFDLEANRKWAESVKFTGLEILRSEESGNKGLVEFRASFEELNTGNKAVHHEVSKFRKQKGVWFYKSGHNRNTPLV